MLDTLVHEVWQVSSLVWGVVSSLLGVLLVVVLLIAGQIVVTNKQKN